MTTPVVSVVMPVYNGRPFLDRAVASLRAQTLPDWELLAVDDASTDDSAARLDTLAAADPRVQVTRLAVNGGVSVARNTALSQARGEWVAYLDQDDEFYSDYLARVHAHTAADTDVLVSRYDLIEERADHPQYGRTSTHDPARFHDRLFRQHIAVPLGVAHRRRLTEHVGGFDERRPREQDSELWRRFAAAGAVFTFLAEPSGLYHVHAASASRAGPPDPPLPPRPAPAPLPWRHPPAAVAATAASDLTRKSHETVAVEVGHGSARHTLHLPPQDAWVAGQIFARGEYAGIPISALADPPLVVDIGGHCGVFAAYARLAWHPRAVIHSFEPFEPHVHLLRRNTAAFPDVTVHPFGLGKTDGTVDLFLDPGSGAGHSTVPGLVANPAGRVPVPVRDAAAVWEELGFGAVDVLKIDAEGAEADILERLGPRLAGVKVLLVEYHTDAARRRVDAQVPGHVLIGAVVHSPRVGTLKYLRADLVPGPAEPPALVRTGPPRVLFASYHCFEDPTSGAALCTHDLFDLLAARGWPCEVFTGPHLDALAPPVNDALRTRVGVTAVPGRVEGVAFTEYCYTAPAGYPVTVFAPDPPAARRPPTPAEARAFTVRLALTVRRFRPNIVLFYGGDPASRAVPGVARAAGARTVFWLHNYAYPAGGPFPGCDAVVVPSADSQAYYRAPGLEPVVLPGPWNWERVRCEHVTPKYATFVNPEPAKGVFWFARIAEVLGRTRPDIPLLVVEGRGTVDWLARCGLALGESGSLRRMRNGPDPRRFYRLSRLVLVPSLWREALSRVAVEAMSNGIPVLGSGRGGLGEVLAEGGIRLDIPARFTPETRTAPSAEEVAEWVAAIVRLWDDPAAYATASTTAKAAAERVWHPDVLAPRWVQFLESLSARRLNQPS